MIEQGTPEWHALRCGKATASRVADAVTRTKTGWAASRANYLAELVAERLTGAQAEGFVSGPMKWGKDCEPQAIAAYRFYTGHALDKVAFVDHPTIPMAGASPDRLVNGDGLMEVKCPTSNTHIATLLGAPIDPAYLIQMQWQLACTGRDWCDWVSFDPRMPEDMALHIERVERDDKRIKELESQVAEFLAEVAAKVDALTAKFRQEAA